MALPWPLTDRTSREKQHLSAPAHCWPGSCRRTGHQPVAGGLRVGAAFAYDLPQQPEIASGYTEKPGWASSKFAVAAANPLAADAGYQVLKAGGTAMDAAVAVQMVLALVEPQSSGLGGGAFLLHASGSTVEAFDGRETAPAAADEKLFLGADGKPMAFDDGVVGGRSVGVPGTVRMLEMAHRQHGKLPWAQLFVPASRWPKTASRSAHVWPACSRPISI